MNIGKAIAIPTTPEHLNIEGLIGSSDSVMTAKGTIHYCETDSSHSVKARSLVGEIIFLNKTDIRDEWEFSAEVDPSSLNYGLSDLRSKENMLLLDNSDKIIGLGSIKEIGDTNFTVEVYKFLSDNHNPTKFKIYQDAFIEAGEQISIPVEVKFLSLVSASATSNVVFHAGRLKKKSNSGLGSSGGGPGGTYTNAIPTPVTLGGISAGTTFLNQDMQQMWDALLYPYQAPAFSGFQMNGINTLEVGQAYNANQIAFWSTTNPANINANSINIDNLTPLLSVASGLPNSGAGVVTQASIKPVAPFTNTWRISGTNSQGGSFTRNHSKNWYWATYFGESASALLVEADILALRAKQLSSNENGTYNMQAGASYKYICYPTSFGLAGSFTDAGTGFAVAMEAPYTVNVTNAYGIATDYYVYRTTNVLNSATDIIVA